MKISEIIDAQKAQPFKPFMIRTADGREFFVPHPEFLFIVPAGRTVVISDTEGRLNIIDVPLIASRHIGNGKKPQTRKKK